MRSFLLSIPILALLRIRILYAVSAHRMGAYVEIHAVPLSGEGELKLARSGDGDDDEACYACAVELARMAGIGLED